MLDFRAANDRAVRHAVQTGHMPDISLIHSLQRHEGFTPCFGRVTEPCPRSHCRWFAECMTLVETPEWPGSLVPKTLIPSK